ncbi:MAG: hypothetical protein EBZ05_02925 [Verrucomicrobia bacterium]|nr:hypothetical protein [Verrucomicrobiota bacterium]NDA25787.1 hypothetical protein [Verrucomicrobiota bacterium]
MIQYFLHYQTLYVVWINFILFIYLLLQINFVWYLPILILSAYFICAATSEITIHRYFTHKSYSVNPKLEKIFLLVSILVGQGSIIHWVAVHRQHHAYEDTIKDPHSPLHVPIWRLFLGIYSKQIYKPSLVADLLKSNNKSYLLFEKKYYTLLWTLIWIICYNIDIMLLLFIVSGSTLWFIGTSLVNVIAHSTGVKRFKNSVGYNVKFLNLITGAGNHNNHHANPRNYTFKVDKEIDIYGSIINLIKVKNYAR